MYLSAPTYPGLCLPGCFPDYALLVMTISGAVTIRHLTLVSGGTSPGRGEWSSSDETPPSSCSTSYLSDASCPHYLT